MKVQATVYRGIEFVSLPELPAEQQTLLQQNSQLERIKILMNGKIKANCILYKDYIAWYSSVYLNSVPAKDPLTQPVALPEIAV